MGIKNPICFSEDKVQETRATASIPIRRPNDKALKILEFLRFLSLD